MTRVEPEALHDLLRYDAESGSLYWLPRPPSLFAAGKWSSSHQSANWNARWAGVEAFTSIHSHGYRHGRIWGRVYFAHRVIWAMQTGAWPMSCIDHRDRDPSNNRWGNLREASVSENMRNQGISRANTSGIKGVTWDAARNKWAAQINLHGKHIYLGRFAEISRAAEAYADASVEIHGEFGRTARVDDPYAMPEILDRDQAWELFGQGFVDNMESME